MSSHYLALLVSVLLTVLAQVFMKAGTQGRTFMGIFTLKMLLGNLLIFFVTLSSLYALQGIPLKEMALVQPVVQVLVVFSGVFLLNEKLSRRQWLMLGVIVLGMLVFKLDAFWEASAL